MGSFKTNFVLINSKNANAMTGQAGIEDINENMSIQIQLLKIERPNTKNNPKVIQESFLKKVYNSLNTDGKLLLAIENRYDYKYFLGFKDPHAQTLFTTILPKKLVLEPVAITK